MIIIQIMMFYKKKKKKSKIFAKRVHIPPEYTTIILVLLKFN
jgi:hypothetical protein